MEERILTKRELNRAVLARQYLLEQTKEQTTAVIKRLVALQGQVSNAPYIGLWTRLPAFQRANLTALLESKQVVRASSLRGTLHIMTAEDYLLFHPILQPALSRNLHLFARQTKDLDIDQFTASLRAYIQEQPRTGVELRAKMEELVPGMGRPQLADAIKMHLGLIHTLPAGTWGFTGRPAYTEAVAWLGSPLASPEAGSHQLILRYLAAFGPASVKDIQKWSGLTRLQPAMEVLRPELLTFRDDEGKELFDLPHAPRPPADTSAPVRFLPEFDNLLLAYAKRGRIMADAYYPSVFTINGLVGATFLVDGFVRGMWRIERTPAPAKLVLEAFEPLSGQTQNELKKEGARLMRWLLDGADAFDIQFKQ